MSRRECLAGAIVLATRAVRPSQPGLSSGALFAELISRCRDRQGLTPEVAREAQKILDRCERDARDAADRLMIDARLDAARRLTDARRELDALNRQIAALHQAQREASLTLEQTRRALDAALGSMPPGRGGSPAGVARSRTSTRTRRALRFLPPILAGATATLAVAAALWFFSPLFHDALRLRGTDRSAARSAAGESSPAAQTTSVASSAHGSAGRVTIALEAKRPVWVRATRDGSGEPGRVLQAGQPRVITVSRQASVRVGDAGAVLVSVNGGPSQPFGRDGQPATRVFGMRDPVQIAPVRAAATVTPIPPERRERAAISAAPVSTTGSLPRPSDAVAQGAAPSVTLSPPDLPTAPTVSNRVEDEIRQTDRQWFESFYRGDRASMARLSAPGFELVDSRAPGERFLPGSAPPQRRLADVRIDVHGDGAVLSGRMIERSADGSRERESFVSEVWVKREGLWRLLGLRLASGSQVRQAAGSLR